MKPYRSLWAVLTVLIVMALIISACGSQATPEPAPTTAPTEAPAAATEAPAADAETPAEAPAAGEAMMGPDGRASYAGLDMDLTGQTIRMANIGGAPYEAMYDSVKLFEEKTGATVEIVFLGDGFQIDRYLKQNYAAGTVDFDVAWNHTSFMSQYTPFVEDLNQYFTPEELAAFSPAIIDAATIDGALQLIPRHADISAMHYRTDLFEDADLQAKFEEEYG
ncbi:MAG: extracellular solute-binding protein, partial [Anaerolineae bacterium]|nr:extracellular solute-binding protein [Anaerolineae bacterium]